MRHSRPCVEGPPGALGERGLLRLNLGCGPHRLLGFENLDLEDGWRFEDGLPYSDEYVEGITISHALMYVPLEKWTFVFAEFYRVLRNEGIVRITEDATDDPRSPRFGGYHDAVTLTSALRVSAAFVGAGFIPIKCEAGETYFRDRSLIQDHHGGAPKVFFVEGLKT